MTLRDLNRNLADAIATIIALLLLGGLSLVMVHLWRAVFAIFWGCR